MEGKRWNGKGKEYDNDSKLVFEGEYLEGKRWNGDEYYYINLNEKMECKYKEGNFLASGIIKSYSFNLMSIIKGTKMEEQNK